MKKKLLAIIILVTLASLSIAGCTVNLPGASSPTPQPTATSEASALPIVTPAATPQPSSGLGVNATISLLTNVLKNNGDTIIQPFTSSTNAVGNTVLACTYRTSTGTITTEKVEICKDSSAVGARFQATINDAIARGYSGDIGSSGSWSGVNSSDRVITVGKLPNNMVASFESE